MWGWKEQSNEPVVLPECPSPKSKEDYQRLAEECLAKVLALEKEAVEEGAWTPIPFHATYGKDDVELLDQPPREGGDGSASSSLRVCGSVECSPAALKRLMDSNDLKLKQNWEREMVGLDVIEEVTDRIIVVRARYKAPFPVTNREFVTIKCDTTLKDGTRVTYGCSINHDRCYADSNFVRGVVRIMGAFYRPVPGSPNMCSFARIITVDPKGNIPAWVVNATKSKAGASIILIRKYINANPLPPAEDREEEKAEEVEVAQPKQKKPKTKMLPSSSSAQRQEKGKEKEEETKQKAKGEEEEIKEHESDEEEAEEENEFYEAQDKLPWDDKPLREMYAQHKQEVREIIQSLQQSLQRIETTTEQTNRQLLSPSSSGGGVVSLSQLSWGTLALLVAWPVAVVVAYDSLASRRPPRNK
ncbi:hypothetical protein QOT17_025107 [Balamuthia mandrillaris]